LVGQNTEGDLSDSVVHANIQVGSYSDHIGGIAGVNGSANANASIIRCSSSGSIQGGYDSQGIGGTVGTNVVLIAGSYSIVSGCYSSVTIVGNGDSSYVGGIVGWNWKEGSVIGYCYATGNIASGANSMYLGVLWANDEGGFVFDSYANGFCLRL
jgi:hypothetical protein